MNMYRDQGRNGSSDSDDDDDDDNLKRTFKLNGKPRNAPIISTVMELDVNTAAPVIGTSRGTKRKVNNIWSAVAQEQAINENMGQVNMQKVGDRLGFDRGCERYDFTRKALDTRPATESDDEINLDYGVSDIENEFDELEGDTSVKEHKKPSKVKFLEKLEDAERIGRDLAKKLKEPKAELIVRSVQVLGKKKVFDLYHMTEDIENNGGMLIVNGTRRRTAGGIFLFNLRKDMNISSKEKNFIFAEDKAHHLAVKKSQMKMLKKREKKKMNPRNVKMEMDICEPKAGASEPEIMEACEPEASVFELEATASDPSQEKIKPELPVENANESTADTELEEGEIP